MTCGPDRLVWRFHDRLRGGRRLAVRPVDCHELAELVGRVERLQKVGEAFAHVRLAPNVARDCAPKTACIGGGGVAKEGRQPPLFVH